MTELLALNEENAVSVFTGDKLNKVLSDIEKEVLSFVPDLSTAKGRKEIASLAYKVSKSKTVLDSAGKTLVSDWKSKAKLVDASRKEAREFLDILRDKVRKPLTDWEAEEERKTEILKLQQQIEADHAEAMAINELIDRERAIAEKERIAAEKEAEQLRIAEEKRIAAEKIERDRVMKEKAALDAKQEAERKAQAEKLQLEQEAQRKVDEAKRVEQEAIDAAKKAEEDRIYAIKRAEFEADQAEKQRLQAIEDARIAQEEAVREAELKAKMEADLVERKRLEAEAEEKRRAWALASNKRHMAKINNEALKCFADNGIIEAEAKKIIKLIATNKIKNITVNY